MSKARSSGEQPGDEVLPAAFASNRQACAFVSLIACALSLPVLISASSLMSRVDSYDIMPENQGAYSFVKNEVFFNQENIDILFVGSSVLWNGVDTPQVQQRLSETLNRPARVVTFGHYFNSIDIAYMQVRDVLQHKKVGMVVISIPRMPYTESASATAYKFIRYNDDEELFARLPLNGKISLYACSVLRTPRDLLTLTRRNQSKPSAYAADLGADKLELGMNRDPQRYENLKPVSPDIAARDLIFSRDTHGHFQFTNEQLPDYQNLYLLKLVAVLKQQNVPFMVLNIPQYSERHSSKIIERSDWSENFGMYVPLVGVAPKLLYAGLSEAEIEKLHFDDAHLNRNGNEFYTATVAPAILEVYLKDAKYH